MLMADVFAINPSGGPSSAGTHVPIKLPNPATLSPLSTIINPSARLRPRLRRSTKDPIDLPDADLGATFTFLPYRPHPLQRVSCLDLALYRPALGQIDLARLSERKLQPSVPEMEVTKRASALTEMMRARVGLVASDLGVESGFQATWQMPLAGGGTDDDLPLGRIRTKETKSQSVPRPSKRYVHPTPSRCSVACRGVTELMVS